MQEVSEPGKVLASVTQHAKTNVDDVFTRPVNIKGISENSEQSILLMKRSGVELDSLGKQLEMIQLRLKITVMTMMSLTSPIQSNFFSLMLFKV